MPARFSSRARRLSRAMRRAPSFVVSSSVVISSVAGVPAGAALAARMQAASWPFMSTLPRPCSQPSVSRRGDQGSLSHPVAGTVSMWPDSAMPPRGPRCATSARLATPAASVKSSRSTSKPASSCSMRSAMGRLDRLLRLSIATRSAARRSTGSRAPEGAGLGGSVMRRALRARPRPATRPGRDAGRALAAAASAGALLAAASAGALLAAASAAREYARHAELPRPAQRPPLAARAAPLVRRWPAAAAADAAPRHRARRDRARPPLHLALRRGAALRPGAPITLGEGCTPLLETRPARRAPRCSNANGSCRRQLQGPRAS